MKIIPPIRKIIVSGFALLLTAFLSLFIWLGYTASILPSVDFLRDPTVSFQITVKDWEGGNGALTVGPDNLYWTALKDIPDYLQQSVLVAEDFNFYHHQGFDWFEVWEAVKKDIEKRRFTRGASTISQQLAKNLFLSREKTLNRKIKELILTRRLENTLSKERILELYLNVVELGPMVYSVGHGSNHYFGRSPAELTLRESTFLVAMLPGPKVYNPSRKIGRVMDRSDHILGILVRAGKITEDDYQAALEEIPVPRGVDMDHILKLFRERAALSPPLVESGDRSPVIGDQ